MIRTAAPGPNGDPSVRLSDRVASITTSGPIWRTCTFCAGRDRTRTGGSGGPFLPQPDAAAARRAHRTARGRSARTAGRGAEGTLQDVTAQVLVLHDVGQHPADVGGGDRDLPLRHFGG